ncbi:MAG: restriction endonuclease subunit M, partial [Clostridia bacterium]|nr:restriction endonuclease subunit M [Clostridia bacterium]
MEAFKIDIKENDIFHLNNDLLAILLKDRTTGKNIIWATDNYRHKGFGYQFHDHITIQAITGYHGGVIKPRIKKSKKEQAERIRNKAEVFTPSWICNKQNNLVDNAWFGTDFVFNEEI